MRSSVVHAVHASVGFAFLPSVGFALLASCATGGAPVFDGPRAIGPSALVLFPVIRLGADETLVDEAALAEQVGHEVRRALAGGGVSIEEAEPAQQFAALRTALLRALVNARGQGNGRLRPGADVGLGELAGATGPSASIVLAVLDHAGSSDGGFVPRAADEVVRLPEDKFEYEVPRAGRQAFATGVDLDLLVVDARSGQVLTHRRVSHPAANVGDIVVAVPVLVREASRGLVSRAD